MFRQWVKQSLKQQGKSHAWLAAQLGVSKESIYQTNNPTLETIQRYSNALGVPFIFDGDSADASRPVLYMQISTGLVFYDYGHKIKYSSSAFDLAPALWVGPMPGNVVEIKRHN